MSGAFKAQASASKTSSIPREMPRTLLATDARLSSFASGQSSRCRPAPSRQAISHHAEHLPPATYLCTYIHTYRARGRLQRIDGLVRCGLAPIEWRRPYASVLPETSVRKSNPKVSKAFEGHSRNIAPESDHEALKLGSEDTLTSTVCVCAVAGHRTLRRWPLTVRSVCCFEFLGPSSSALEAPCPFHAFVAFVQS